MPLKLMYITNDPEVAKIAESAGVDRIFVDMEFLHKAERQGGLDTVQNHHTLLDVTAIHFACRKAETLVRINPWHEESSECISSAEEIEGAISRGADILMLPYFKKPEEVEKFLACVHGRKKTMLLLETKDAVDALDEIMSLPGIDEVHIGLNDLSISLNVPFMFQLLADGTVEQIVRRLQPYGVPYGFGGIASLGRGSVPADMIIKEHYRLGSQFAILSRSFCNLNKITGLDAVGEIFFRGLREIRKLEAECNFYRSYFEENRKELVIAAGKVNEIMKAR